MLVALERRNFFGRALGGGAAKVQPFAGAIKGSFTGGRDPISCSSKHSTEAGLEATDASSAAKSPVTDDGRETVANDCVVGNSKACLLEESTARADFGGELLRPSKLLILSCHPPADGCNRTS
jgi:hypothetical protein